MPCKYCVCCVCVHSLDNSVPSVPTVRVCGVLAETKSVGLVPSQAENLKEKFDPMTIGIRTRFVLSCNVFRHEGKVDSCGKHTGSSCGWGTTLCV